MVTKSLFCLFVVFAIVMISVSPSMAYTLDDIEWSDSSEASGTLHWGDTLEAGNYTIKAEDFSKDGYVSIGIYQDGNLQDASPVRSGNGFEYRDTENGEDIRVFVKSMDLNIDEWTGNMEDPTAAIEVYERGIPEMNIVIETDHDTYDPRSITYPYIIATIDINNEGDAKAYDMDMEIDVDGMELIDGDLTQHFLSIEEDDVLDPIEIKLELPHYWEKTDVDITVTTRSEDINGDIHEDVETKTITIEPVVELMVTKTVTEKIYMDETVHVSVSIWNNGIYSLSSVKVSNPVTTDLELQDNVDDGVTLSFGQKETKAKIFEYTLKPTKTGKYTVPAATATFTAPDGKELTFISEKSTIEINGPDIVLTKEVNPSSVYPGNETTVKVTVKNQGTRDASVTTTETMPEDATFVSGDILFDDIAVNGKSYSYSYVIRVDDIGEIKLPETTATFIDMEDYKGEKISNTPILTVLDPAAQTEESTTSGSDSSSSSNNNDQQSSSSDQSSAFEEDTEERVEPGFEATFMILALFGVYFVSRRKDRS